MASTSKSKKNCDRISNLPDCLITHILSSLSTKDAVKTSLLSTSWHQQWTLLPVIRFGERFSCLIRCSPSFVNFVYGVLLNNVTSLDLFQLLGGGGYDAKDVRNWISVVLSRHVREIDVSAKMRRRCRLPDCLYTSKTLVVLKLKGYFVFRVPEKISFESLRIFHYSVANFEDCESFSWLVSSCPVLEELEITGRLKENVEVLNISSLVLKRLILRDLYSVRSPNNEVPHAYELALNTPCLQYLEHNDKDGVPDGYHINTLHRLDTARLNLYLDYDELERYAIDPLIPARSLGELVVVTSSVRVLYIFRNAFEALYGAELPNFEMPKFHSLISLELGSIETDAGLRLLMAFLQSSPQLESLCFYIDCWKPWSGAWYPPTDVPFCLLYNLKVIKVDYLHHLNQLLRVLAYFLEKTKRLKKLLLLPSKERDEEFIKKVLMLPRASKSCEIVLT